MKIMDKNHEFPCGIIVACMLVLMNATYSHEYIKDSSGVFYFDTEYEISNSTLIEEISDYYSIYAEYETGLEDDD